MPNSFIYEKDSYFCHARTAIGLSLAFAVLSFAQASAAASSRLKCHASLRRSTPESSSWIDAILDGKNKKAAQALDEIADDLPTNSADPTYRNLIRATAKSLKSDFEECAEKSKVVVFRGYKPGRTDVEETGDSGPFFVAKVLASKDKQRYFPEKIKHFQGDNVFNLASKHSNTYLDKTPLLSASYQAATSNNGDRMLVLKMCPQRVMAASSGKFVREFEILIPFFIHPDEVLAIIEPQGEITRGDFSIIYSQVRERDSVTINTIKEAAQANMRMVNGEAYNFDDRFEKMLRRRLSAGSKNDAKTLREAIVKGVAEQDQKIVMKDPRDWTDKEFERYSRTRKVPLIRKTN